MWRKRLFRIHPGIPKSLERSKSLFPKVRARLIEHEMIELEETGSVRTESNRRQLRSIGTPPGFGSVSSQPT